MTRARAEVGDLVSDANGRHAIVTDIRQGTDWVLRPESGSPTTERETDEPGTLDVIETRRTPEPREDHLMRSRHKARGGAVDSVQRFCVGVWFTGHLAAAVTLGTLITNDHQDLATSQRPTVSQPDASPDEADRAF